MLVKKWNVVCFILFGVFVSASKGLATENVQPEYRRVSIGFVLPKPFNYTEVTAANDDNDMLKSIVIMYKKDKLIIDRKHLKDFANVDLKALQIYEGIYTDLEEEKGIIKANEIESFSLCFRYGEFKEGLRLNRKGWHRNVFQIIVYPNGTYKIRDFPVESQNLPISPCL